MQGTFTTWRAAALYLSGWLLLGLLLSAMLVVSGADWQASLIFAPPLALLYAFAGGYSAYYICRAYPLGQGNVTGTVRGVGVTALLVAGIWCAIGAGWNSLWHILLPTLAIDLNPVVTTSMFGLGILLYGLTAAINYLSIESERVRQLETQRLQIRLTAQEAELRMLRTQVDPHFLFNSLNSISALTSIDPSAARTMVVQLAEFFRCSLGLQSDRKITLAEEIRLVGHFIAIEQVRFGSRLSFNADISNEALDCLVPPMILQPLVENAVKHGIGNMLEPGAINVRATLTGASLHIQIENDIDSQCHSAPGTSIGLKNVRQRLEVGYGHQAAIRWRKEPATFHVDLTLPAEHGIDSTNPLETNARRTEQCA